jgi:hypothetical protein
MSKIEPKEKFISIPIYLDQKVVFDHLAIIEDGFSQFSNIVETESEDGKLSANTEASLGTTNALAFLGISLGAKAGAATETAAASQSQTTKTKIHTPTSLFHIYRDYLLDQQLLQKITSDTELKSIVPGSFVEIHGSLEENPVSAFFSSISELMTSPIMKLMGNKSTPQSSKNKGGSRQDKEVLRIIQSLVDESSNDLIVKAIDPSELSVLLATQEKYFMEGWRRDIIDGEFTVIGKVIKNISETSEVITLVNQGLLKYFPQQTLEELVTSMDVNSSQINLPELKISLESPAMKVYPIAICV